MELTKKDNALYKLQRKKNRIDSTFYVVYGVLYFGLTTTSLTPLTWLVQLGTLGVVIQIAITLAVLTIITGNLVREYRSIEEWTDGDTTSKYWDYGIDLDELNKVVVVGEHEDGVGKIRRLYTILTADSKGRLCLTEDIRELKDSESYKIELCEDVILDKKEWEKVKESYILISETKAIKEGIEDSRKNIESQRNDLKLELSRKDEYLKQYRNKNGYKQLPTQLMKDKEELDKEVSQLNNELLKLGNELGQIQV